MLSSLPLATTGPLHPAVVYMRGVTGVTLIKLLDFMYNGEVNVERTNIKEFLQCGEELRVEGLCEKAGQEQEQEAGGQVQMVKEESPSKPLAAPRPAPSTKQREKTERKKERMEKKKRKVPHSVNVQKVEALPTPRAAKRKEVVEKIVKEEEKAPTPVPPPAVTPVKPEPEVPAPVTVNDSFNSKQYDVYELCDSSEENENLSLRDDSRTPRKKAKKSLAELKDEAINRDVLTMDPGEAHGILKLVENLDTIEENSEDLNVFVRLLNQLILKSDIASSVLFFCGICQKSLKSKPHMLNHIESSHVNGVYHKCADCGVKYKTRGSLSSHKLKIHKQPKKDDLRPEDGSKVDGDKNEVELSASFIDNKSSGFEMSNNVSGSDENSSTGEMD